MFLDAAELYTQLERGFVDAVTTSLLLAAPARLYEVANHMAGPLIGFGYTNNVINKDVWNKIPEDLQQIITEEGAKAELEGLRLAPFQNLSADQRSAWGTAVAVLRGHLPAHPDRRAAGIRHPRMDRTRWIPREGR